jgi:hypothetical protein
MLDSISFLRVPSFNVDSLPGTANRLFAPRNKLSRMYREG